MNKFLDNVKVTKAFLAVSVLPVLLSIGFAAWIIIGNNASVRDMAHIRQLVTPISLLSGMVHEQQKERGMTAVFMAGNGGKLQSQLVSKDRKHTSKYPR